MHRRITGKLVIATHNPGKLTEMRELLHTGEGPILVSARISEDDVPRVLPIRDGHAIKQRFIAALNGA